MTWIVVLARALPDGNGKISPVAIVAVQTHQGQLRDVLMQVTRMPELESVRFVGVYAE